jgi:hypothetical protein
MIKVQIEILDGELDIEIKKDKDQYFILVILSKSGYYKENGRAWNGKTMDEPKVLEITYLIRECYTKPSIPERITICDGMAARISLKEEGSEVSFTILNNFDEGTFELQLLQTLFDLVNEMILDTDLKKYSRVFGYLK